MKQYLAEVVESYTGEQLRSNFAYEHFGVIGDSIVAFCGPCDVKADKIVDIEDLKAGSVIYSEHMLHFIVEHHDTDMERNVLRQIMLANIVKDTLNDMLSRVVAHRKHTDLYDGDAKLSVSVATVSPLSSLIHFGVNISSANTPVQTKGLQDYGVDHEEFARVVMQQYVADVERLHVTRCKVKWVQ